MERFKTPSPLSLTSNPADNWHSWEQSFRRYIAASGEKDEKVKIDILLNTIGEDALKVYNTLTVRAEGDELTMEDVLQAFKERLHIKQEPEMFSEGQEENQLCVQQETNSAACPVKYEDEEEKPQASQLHWRQLTEINMKEEPSPCSLNELMTGQSVGINSNVPEAAQNPDPNSLVLQGPDETETDSSQTEDSSEDYEDDDEDCWQKPLSESEAEADFDSTRKKRKISDSSKNPEMGRKASKTQIREKPFECEKPFKCFPDKGHLQSHMIIHTGEKPFKCDVCGKSFSHKSNLKSHNRIHKGDKPFKCDVCSNCFTDKGHLQSHMIIHTGEKPFECDVCRKCFTRKSTLQSHMIIHTGEKPFECDVCRKCFTCKSTLQKCFTCKSHLQS
uniref:Zinc finger protein 493-like n=1 Tax=Gouania willdenowi TaxID=441366 RepID=A0A8C5GQ82_GOUWI